MFLHYVSFFSFFCIFPGTYSLGLLTHTTDIIYSVSEQLFLGNGLHKDSLLCSCSLVAFCILLRELGYLSGVGGEKVWLWETGGSSFFFKWEDWAFFSVQFRTSLFTAEQTSLVHVWCPSQQENDHGLLTCVQVWQVKCCFVWSLIVPVAGGLFHYFLEMHICSESWIVKVRLEWSFSFVVYWSWFQFTERSRQKA